MILNLMVFLTYISLAAAVKSCDNKLCNDEGECILENSERVCKCVGETFFKGVDCKELIDNCANNPCKNGARCENQLGHYYCDCPDGWRGQNCEIQKKAIYKRFHLHYNRLAVLVKEQIFLIMVEEVGEFPSSFEMSTEDNFIDGFKFGEGEQGIFTKSNNLPAVAKSFGLLKIDKVPITKGFYRVAKAKFSLVGPKEIVVVIGSLNDAESFYMHKFRMQVYKPDSMECVPEAFIPLWSSPRPILQVDVSRYHILKPVVQRRCASDSKIVYKWSVWNFVGNVHLHDFPETQSSILKIPPYRLWFDYSDDYHAMYRIYAEVKEQAGGRNYESFMQGFVFVEAKPVQAYIVGGLTRAAGVGRSLTLDGSQSRNYAFPPDGAQYLTYNWDCKPASDADKDADFCKTNMGSDPKLSIASDKLIFGKSYVFSLTARTTKSHHRSDVYQQTVTVAAEEPLLADIRCIRNCFDGRFTPQQIVHLKAVCINCADAGAATYSWTKNGNALEGQQKRVVYMSTAEAESAVKVQIKEESRSGNSELKLLLNKPPSGGSCSIEPGSGKEYETEFTVKCAKYEDEDTPLRYEYIADEMTLERTANPVLTTRLPPFKSLKVRICDVLNACTEAPLGVSLTAFAAPASAAALQTLLQQEGFNLRQMLRDGKTTESLVFVDLVLQKSTSLDVAILLNEQLSDFAVETLLAAEQFTVVTRNLLKPMQPLDNEKAALFAELFTKVADGYAKVILDGEVGDLLKDPYELITNSLVAVMTEFSVPLEEIPPVQLVEEVRDPSNPLKEQHPAVAEFDETVLSRVRNWLQAVEQLNLCFHRLGIMASYIHEPTEKPYNSEKGGVTLEVFAFESRRNEVKTKDVEVFLGEATVAELKGSLRSSSLLTQTVSFKKNPFWWYPSEHSLSTDVMFFSIFSRRRQLDSVTTLRNPIEFSIKLRSENSQRTTTARLETAKDMSMFSARMSQNSVLVVKFTHLTDSLRAMLRLGEKPRGYMLLKSQVVAPGSEDSRYILVNNGPEEAMGYLAVMAANGVSGGGEFTFEMVLRHCLSWDSKAHDPEWNTQACIPVEDQTTSEHLYCRCSHLSSFAGQLISTPPLPLYGNYEILDRIPINWYMVIFYLALAGLSTFVLWLTRRRLLLHKTEPLSLEVARTDSEKTFDILVVLHTGSPFNADSTANLLLGINTAYGYKKYVIYQNSARPRLTQNSTNSVRLPLKSNDLFLNDLKLTVQQDGSGRYPEWFCAAISFHDMKTGQATVFRVGEWISTDPVRLEAVLGDAEGKRTKFRSKLANFNINWFGFQAVVGPWRCGEYNLSQRTIIWIVKVAVSVCIVALFFGRTTLETFEEEREMFKNLSISALSLFAMCFLCYVVAALFEVAILHFFLNKTVEKRLSCVFLLTSLR